MDVATAPVPVMLQSGTKQIGSSFYESTGEAPLKGTFAKAGHFDLVLLKEWTVLEGKKPRTEAVDGELVAYGAFFPAYYAFYDFLFYLVFRSLFFKK